MEYFERSQMFVYLLCCNRKTDYSSHTVPFQGLNICCAIMKANCRWKKKVQRPWGVFCSDILLVKISCLEGFEEQLCAI